MVQTVNVFARSRLFSPAEKPLLERISPIWYIYYSKIRISESKGEIIMLGFHTDGIRFFGASDSLLEKAKKHKLPIVKKSTTNTLVFAIDTAEGTEAFFRELPPQPTRLMYKLAVAAEVAEELEKRI